MKLGGGIEWQIVKLESANLPKDFPNTFPFSKDIDIVCSPKCYEELVGKSVKFFADVCENYYDKLKIIREENRCRIRIELKNYLVFLVDIVCSLPGLSDDFILESLSRREIKHNYYVPCVMDELCYRYYELTVYPMKKQHREYIKYNEDYLNMDLVRDSMTIDITEI